MQAKQGSTGTGTVYCLLLVEIEGKAQVPETENEVQVPKTESEARATETERRQRE